MLPRFSAASRSGRKDIDGAQAPAPVERDADDAASAASRWSDFYHETLKQSPEALAYLEKRGLDASGDGRATSSSALPTARWATAAGTRTARPARRCAGACSGWASCARAGHEHFNGSLVIPVFDRATATWWRCTAARSRANLRPGTPLHLYLPGPHRGVWNEEALEASKEIILCESLIDALTFWCAGFRNVTASYGVNGFTDDHRAAFQKHGTQQVLIAYDRDEAGEKAAASAGRGADRRWASSATACCFRKGMDANEYALKVTPAAQEPGGVLLNQSAEMAGEPPSHGSGDPAAKEETASDSLFFL